MLGLDEAKPRIDVEAVAGAGRKQKSATAAAPCGEGRVAANADACGDADDNGDGGDDSDGDNTSDGGIQGDSEGKHGDDTVARGAGDDGAAAAGSQTATPRPSPRGKKEKNAPGVAKKKK